MRNLKIISFVSLFWLLFFSECTKTEVSGGSLYTPTEADVTANATLTELQNGRNLYMQNCGACHNLYAPEVFSVTQWKSVLSSMAKKTKMTSTETQLVTKYVCKGKQ